MTFEDLNAWKKARELVNRVYSLTREGALAKNFGLCGQIQRAAVSVMSNVAEGFERAHAAEKLQAYNIARSSCGEVRSLLYVIYLRLRRVRWILSRSKPVRSPYDSAS